MKYITFTGFSRDGHTLIAACLDAHPNVAIANRYGLRLPKEASALVEKLKRSSAAGKGFSGRFKLTVEGQGKWTTVEAVGHTMANNWHYCPEGLDHRPICPIRNPYDLVGRHSRVILGRHHRRRQRGETVDVSESEVIFHQIKILKDWAKEADRNINERNTIPVYLESFIASPNKELRRLTEFIGLDWLQGWADRCDVVVWDKPRLSRKKIRWSTVYHDEVGAIIDKYEWMARYR